MSATAEQLNELTAINQQDNGIPYVATPGPDEVVDWWSNDPVPGRSWVCRDYCLKKADDLHAVGWSRESTTIVICYVETGERHAVLAVDDGEPSPWILDSRFGPIYRMDAPPTAYRWEMRQVAGSTEFASLA